jgi:hypothetical protein
LATFSIFKALSIALLFFTSTASLIFWNLSLPECDH